MSQSLKQRVSELYSPQEYELFLRAYGYAKKAHEQQKRMSGEPYFIHPYEVTNIVIDLGLDIDTICASLLHDVVEDTPTTYEEIQKEFNTSIADLVDGVTKLSRIGNITKEEQQAQSMRKMFLAMAKDIRVIFIKLADRLHNMRTLEYGSREQQIRKAKETIEIYAPLAHRLGINAIKTELEDLCFRYLYPEDYFELKRVVEEHHQQRQLFLRETMQFLTERLETSRIFCEISGRDKSLYSIYKKMKKQNATFEQIYDITAIRVLVDTIKDCYSVLGIVHDSWMPIPGRFKDYIAMPKQNMYQSLHTTLIGKGGIPFEIQIRTFEMHRVAEYGISAHWKYKEGTDPNDDLDTKLGWLRSLMEWQDDLKDANEFMQTLRVDFFSDEVFVFTPKGDVKNLYKGSTPIDFAYAIHSDVGNKCVGAKINNKIATLDTPLENGDIIEIITSKSAKGPSRDWLSIAKTHQAKSKIRAFFKKELKQEHIQEGRAILEKEIKRLGAAPCDVLTPEMVEMLLKKLKLPSMQYIYAGIGYGGITANQVTAKIAARLEAEKPQELPPEQEPPPTHRKNARNKGVIVEGSDDMLVRFSRCCNPLPGDEIVGYITRGRGVSIHRTDCPNLADMGIEEQRFVTVQWVEQTDSEYVAKIHIAALESKNLLFHITKTIAELDMDALSMVSHVGRQHSAVVNVSVKIASTQQLKLLIKKIKALPDVQDAYRIGK